MDGYGGDGANSVNGLLNWPYGVFVDGTGNILIADQGNNRVRVALQLTSSPVFVYGNGQTIDICQGVSHPLDYQLAVGGMDAGSTEIWTVVTPPAHGALAGFPAAALSHGVDTVSIPRGTVYSPTASYSGIDSFQVRVSNGFSSSLVTVYVSIGANSPGTISGGSIVCLDSPLALNDAVTGGVWSSSNNNIATIDPVGGLVTATGNGTDTIFYYMYSGGCDYSVITAGVVAGNISGSNTVCAGSEITLADPVPGGTWSATGSDASVSASGVVTGLYPGATAIEYSVTNACGTATTEQVVTITDCTTTGISSRPLVIALNVYPNPASSVVDVQWTDPAGSNASVAITDITGRELYRGALVAGNTQIDISSFPAGVYFVKTGGTEVKKFIKE